MKKIYVERQGNIIKVAIKEDDVLRECYIDKESEAPGIGEIYKGIIKKIVPSMHCAFVDIGYRKNAYISLESMNYKKGSSVKTGDEILCEVIKEEVGKKGPKVSRTISLPGTYVVVTNEFRDIQVSKRISSDDFRTSIKAKLEKPEYLGVVVRTRAEEAPFEAVYNEVQQLAEKYDEIYSKFTYSLKPGCLFSDRGILTRVVRNNMDDKAEIIVSDPDDYEYFCRYLKDKNNSHMSVELYEGALSLFDYYSIERDILALRHNRVNLPSGGNIVLEDTEAMHVIDVNTAANIKENGIGSAILETNVEAAEEIARQVRLRNLGGIILIDFINMKNKDERQKVFEALSEGFRGDKNNTRIYPFTELDLVQITRRKYGSSIMEYLISNCSYCKGTGKYLSLDYLYSVMAGKVRRIKEEQGVHNVFITINSHYEKEIKSNILEFIKNTDTLDCDVYIEFEDIQESFRVEPLIFHSQIEAVKNLRIFSSKEESN